MAVETLTRVDVANLDPQRWQALTRGRPLLSLELLQECAEARNGRLVVLLVGPPESPEGAAVGTICPGDPADAPLEGLLFGRLKRLAVALSLVGPAFVVGSPIGQDSGVVLPGGGAEPSRSRALLEALERWATREQLGLAFLALAEGGALDLALPERWRSLVGRSRTTTEMRVTWTGFDQYVATLGAQTSAGKMVRRERRRNAEAGVVIRILPADESGAAELQRLAELHYRLRNHGAEYLAPGMLPRALPRMGERVRILEAVRDGRRCAMMALVRSGAVGWPAFIGIEPEDRPNDFTYFNLAYYEIADAAATLGLETILYGNSVVEAKVRRGAVRVPMRFVVLPRGRLRRMLMGLALRLHGRFVAPKFA